VLDEQEPDLLELLAAEAHFLAAKMSLVDLGRPVDRVWPAHPRVDPLKALAVVGVSEERASSVVEISAQDGVRHANHTSVYRPADEIASSRPRIPSGLGYFSASILIR
jgi:hypothetical protein